MLCIFLWVFHQFEREEGNAGEHVLPFFHQVCMEGIWLELILGVVHFTFRGGY